MARLPDGRIGLFRLRQRPFAYFRERHDALLTTAVLAAHLSNPFTSPLPGARNAAGNALTNGR